jgi:hypothetical protein
VKVKKERKRGKREWKKCAQLLLEKKKPSEKRKGKKSLLAGVPA